MAWCGLASADAPTGLADPNEDATPAPAPAAATPAPTVAIEKPAPEPPDELPPVEIGMFGGGFISNNRHQFYDLPTSVTKFGSSIGRPTLDRVAPQLGLRLAYYLDDNLGLEGDFSWTLESTEMADAVTILHFGGSLVGQLPVRNEAGKKTIVPFGEIGFGVWDSKSDALGNAVHFPVHVGAGARVYLTDQFSLRADFRYYRGPGDTEPYTLGAGYAEFGIGVSWVPHIKPSKPEPVPIVGDRDGDGIPDDKDACPNEPEDKDMFLDSDGCPDPDNDGDGIPDASDKCPLDPEDCDGYQDADGCPDPDNDGDGIPDVTDKCPNEPEDKDGYQDLDGCPDPDNDGDGIGDGADKCPNEPETINGVQDEDGCTDRGDALVVLSPERLELLEPIAFDKDKLAKKSTNLLGQIAATLRAHSEIARLRVTVYVQPTKSSDKDQELSEKRANAIRDWLITWGIDGKRLVSRGFGGTKPLVPADQKGAASMNDRIELIILERK
jgi:outer membrane protein OmpA-like peptidoglycan-associated protein